MKVEDQELDYYERFWKREGEGENIFFGLPDWRLNLEKRSNFFKGIIKGRILDAGCGAGDFSINITKDAKVDKVYGIDLSKTVIEKCLKRAKGIKSGKLSFRKASVTNLPFKNNSFDAVFAFEIVEHIVDTEKMFQEFNRVLKKGGYLAITTVDFNLLKMIIIALFYFETYFDPTAPHIRFFTKNTLRKVLEKKGFKVIRYKWDGSYFGIMPKGQVLIAQKLKDISD